jgi:ribosomal protein L3 glutamine methyltransferase
MLAKAGDYLSDHGSLFIEVGNSQAAMMEKYTFLPMTWVEFEYGGGGVCCIQGSDLKQQQRMIESVNV